MGANVLELPVVCHVILWFLSPDIIKKAVLKTNVKNIHHSLVLNVWISVKNCWWNDNNSHPHRAERCQPPLNV